MRLNPLFIPYRRLPLLLLFLVFACGDPALAPAPEVDPVPRPDLERVEMAVREQLEKRIAAVEGLARDPGAGAGQLAEAYGDLGRLYHAYDLTDAAEACYRNARRLEPEDFRWWYYAAFLSQVRGDLAVAEELYREALARRPDDLPTLLRLATVRLDLDRPDDARALFERALELEPGAAAAHHGLGKVAGRAGEPQAAVEHFARALALEPQASLIHYPLALAYRELGDSERAEHHLALRGNAGPTFPDPLVEALDGGSVGAGRRLTRAGLAFAEGRDDIALAELREAVAAAPENLSARLDLGRALGLAGELDAAREELGEALRLAPGSALAHDAMGVLEARAGDDGSAIEHFRRAVELDPDFASAHFELGAALARQGRHQEAAAVFSRVLELDPQRAAAWLARATARADAGDLDGARTDLETLLEQDPENARAHLRLGEVLQRQGDRDARRHYRRVLELDPPPADAAAAHFSLANLLAGDGAYEAAVERYSAALGFVPDLAGARSNLAGVLSRLGRYEEAELHYRRIVELRPGDAAARFYLAQALLALGRFDEAAEAFAGAVAADPGRESERARLGEASALIAAERYREARDRLESHHAALPESGPIAHALARMLAACPERRLRDGARAVELALAVVQARQTLEHAETVAMAFAEVGDFDRALRWQREVLAQAEAAERPELAAIFRKNLALYERGQRCCSPE